VGPALERVGDFAAFLGEPFDEAMSYAALRKAESVGRPVGSKGVARRHGSAHRLDDRPAQAGTCPEE
jgi:hypothetical protein